jgi:hypothetical protein
LYPLPIEEGWGDKEVNRNFQKPGTQVCVHFGTSSDYSDLCIIIGRNGQKREKSNNRSYPNAPSGTATQTKFHPNQSSQAMIDLLKLYDCVKEKLKRTPTMELNIK